MGGQRLARRLPRSGVVRLQDDDDPNCDADALGVGCCRKEASDAAYRDKFQAAASPRRFETAEQVAYSPPMEAAGPNLRILVDADACPVKDEIYRSRRSLRATSLCCREQRDPHPPCAANRADCRRRRPRRRGRLDRRTGRPGSNRRYVGHSARQPVHQIGSRRHRSQRETLYRKLDRDGPGDAQSDGPPSLVRTVDSGAKAIRPARPFEFPQRA